MYELEQYKPDLELVIIMSLEPAKDVVFSVGEQLWSAPNALLLRFYQPIVAYAEDFGVIDDVEEAYKDVVDVASLASSYMQQHLGNHKSQILAKLRLLCLRILLTMRDYLHVLVSLLLRVVVELDVDVGGKSPTEVGIESQQT